MHIRKYLYLVLSYAQNHREVFHYLAYCNSQLGNYAVAKKYSDESLNRKKDWAEGYILAAEIDYKLGFGTEALKYYDIAIENEVESIQLYISWTLMLLNFDKFEEAKEKCLFVLQIEPTNDVSLYNLGFCHYSLGEFEEAMLCVSKMIELHPSNLNAYVLQGKIYARTNEYHKAIETYKHVVSQSNKFYPVYADIANSYKALGDNEKAVKYFEKTIEYVPDMTIAYVDCAKLHCEMGDIKSALRKIRKAYSLEKENPYVIFTYGAVLMYDEKYEEALGKFKLVVENGKIKEAKLGIIESLMYLNKLDEAIQELEKVKDEFQDSTSFAKLNFELNYRLAQNTNSEYNIEQALMLCERVEKICGEDMALAEKKAKLQEMSKREQ